MNTILKSLHTRKSVRVFTEQTISKEDKETILTAALQAPSAGCQLLYTILDITEQEKKEKLAELCDHQPFIAKAKMVMVFCADCRKWLSFYKEAGLTPREPGAGGLLLAVEDALIAAQNAVVAAESMGIGFCYIGDVMENAEGMCKALEELLEDRIVAREQKQIPLKSLKPQYNDTQINKSHPIKRRRA